MCVLDMIITQLFNVGKNMRGDLTAQVGYVINMLQGVGAKMKIKKNKELLNLVIGYKPLRDRMGIRSKNLLTVNLQKEGWKL